MKNCISFIPSRPVSHQARFPQYREQYDLKNYYCRESEPNYCESRALSLPAFQYNGHTCPSGDQFAGEVNHFPVKIVHFPGTLIRQAQTFTFRNGCAGQYGIVYPKPRPELIFVFAIHCKSRINNIHIKKSPWIPRASETLRIHTYEILSQQQFIVYQYITVY